MRICIALFATLGLIAGPAAAGEPAKDGGHQMPKLIQKTDAHHGHFTTMAGDWKVVQTMYMPDGKEMKAEGKQTITTILNGLGMTFSYEAPMGPMTMLGHGLSTWIPEKKMYQSIWMDNMSRQGMWTGWGTFDPATKTMNEMTRGPDPNTGKEMEMRMVTVMTSPDAYTASFFMKGPDGKEMKTMTMAYTRIK